MSDRTMNGADMIRTNNEWMRRYIEESERFEREFQSVTRFLSEQAAGGEPSYGARCETYQFHLLAEMNRPAI